jgi:hypothetical protein
MRRASQPSPLVPSSGPAISRRPWHPPALEHLGAWRALTLQQSIPIGPGGFGLRAPRSDAERMA